MSSFYNLEPQPTGSCILHTTSGDISLELFAQQTPLTCRNFLQHCLDGYYDNTIFHRLIPGFILQGGDPTGTGNGGSSIYNGGAFAESENGIWPMEERKGANAGAKGVGFKDEFHSRLKFNRRGLLAMANEGKSREGEGSNGSQFFITLGAAAELQGVNTLFGRVEGETIYNVARMGEMEVDVERPVYPVTITSVEVLVNPFKDMVKRKRVAAALEGKPEKEKKKKRKAGKQLLSFGGEEGDEEVEPVVKKTKFDTRIVMDVEDSGSKPTPAKESKTKVTKPDSIESSPEPVVLKPLPNRASKVTRDISFSPEPEPVQKAYSLLERTNAQIAELKASMKRNIHQQLPTQEKKSALEQLIPATSTRGRKRHRVGNQSSQSDQYSLSLLTAFQEKLQQAPPPKSEPKFTSQLEDLPDKKPEVDDEDDAAVCDLHFIANCQSCQKWDAVDQEESDEDDDGIGWMSHALSFKEDKLGKDLSYRKKAEEEMVVIDPREKTKTLKEESRAKREAKAGQSGRAWDQSRNEKLARESALAGRGAK